MERSPAQPDAPAAGPATGGGGPGPPVWQLVAWWAASVAAALAHNGLWATPNLAFVSLIAENPGENPFTGGLAGDYLMTNVSLTGLAALLGQTAPHEVARLGLVVLVLGWAAVTALARRNHGHDAGRNLTVALAAAPLVTVSLQWLGQPDPLTGLCGVAMVLVRRRWAVVALGVLAGLTHPEQAVFMAGVAGVTRSALPGHAPAGDHPREAPGLAAALRRAAVDVATAVGGVAVGWAATQLWFAVENIVLTTPRSDYLGYGLQAFAEHHAQHPLGLLWTLWGPLWLVLAALALRAAARRRRGHRADPAARWATGAMAAMGVLALVPVAVTLDETRVYAVLTAPLLAGGALWVAARVRPASTVRASVALLVVTAVLPGGFATGVTSWRPQLDTPAMVAFLADGTVPPPAEWPGAGEPDGPAAGEPGDLTGWLLAPFDLVIPELPG